MTNPWLSLGAPAAGTVPNVPPPAPHSGPLGFLWNAASDATSLLGGFVTGTLGIGKDLATGNVGDLERMGKGLLQNYQQRYGSVGGFLHGLYTHPLQDLLDFSAIGGLAGKAADVAAAGDATVAAAAKLPELAGGSGLGLPTFDRSLSNVLARERLSPIVNALRTPTGIRTALDVRKDLITDQRVPRLVNLPEYARNPVGRLLLGQQGPIHNLLTEQVNTLETRAKNMYDAAVGIHDPGAEGEARNLAGLAEQAKSMGLQRVYKPSGRVMNRAYRLAVDKVVGRVEALAAREDASHYFVRAAQAFLHDAELPYTNAYARGFGMGLTDPNAHSFTTVLRGPSGTPRVYFHGTATAFEQFSNQHVGDWNLMGPGHYFTDDPGIANSYVKKAMQDQLAGMSPQDTEPFVNDLRQRLHDSMGQLEQQHGDRAGSIVYDLTESLANATQSWGGASRAAQEFELWGLNVDDLLSRHLPNAAPGVHPVVLALEKPFRLDEGRQDALQNGEPWTPADGAPIAPEELKALRRGFIAKGADEHDLAALDAAQTHDEAWNVLSLDGAHPDVANEVLQAAGFDGLTHLGGLHMGRGGALHNVGVVFPNHVEAIRPQYEAGGFAPASGLSQLPVSDQAAADFLARTQRPGVADYSGAEAALKEAAVQPGSTLTANVAGGLTGAPHFDPDTGKLVVTVNRIQDMALAAQQVLGAFGAHDFYDVQNHIDGTGALGASGLGLRVLLPDGSLAEVEVHTPPTLMAREALKPSMAKLDEATQLMQNAPDPEAFSAAADSVVRQQRRIERVNEHVRFMVADELGGRPLQGLRAWQAHMALGIEHYITGPLIAGGKLDPVTAFNHAYMPLQMLRGAEWDMEHGGFKPGEELTARMVPKAVASTAGTAMGWALGQLGSEDPLFEGMGQEMARLHIDPLTIDRDLSEQNLPMPLYTPDMDIARVPLSDYGLTTMTTKGILQKGAFAVRQSKGVLLDPWVQEVRRMGQRLTGDPEGIVGDLGNLTPEGKKLAQSVLEVQTPKDWRHASGRDSVRFITNIPETLSMRAARVQKWMESQRIAAELTNKFGRFVGYLHESDIQRRIGQDERFVIPEAMLKAYRYQVGIDDLYGSQKGDFEKVAQKLLGDFIPANAEDMAQRIEAASEPVSGLGFTRKGIEVYAVPKVIADRIEQYHAPRLGQGFRLAWDTPLNAWRSIILFGSPAWTFRVALGQVTALTMQGGRVGDVLRQFEKSYRDRVQAIVPPGTLQGGIANTGEAYVPKLGMARDTPVGRVYDKVAQVTTNYQPFRGLRTWGQANLHFHRQLMDMFRTASYLKAHEAQLIESGVLKNASHFWTSQETLNTIAKNGFTDATATKAMEEMNYFMGNYLQMPPLQRQYLRRLIAPFWGFYRHFGRIAATYALKYPLRAEAMQGLAVVDQAMQQDQLGQVPDYLRGVLPVGGALFSTRAVDPFQSIAGEDPSALLNPMAKTAIEMMGGRSLLTGKQFTDPGVVHPYGSENAFVIRNGQVYRTGDVHPSIIEEMLSQFPAYDELKNLVVAARGASGTYSTATLFDVLRNRGIIRDQRTGGYRYPTSRLAGLAEQLGAFLGPKFYPQELLTTWQQQQAKDAGAALTQSQGGSTHGGNPWLSLGG